MNRIPEIIHYFWIGGAKKPDPVLRCIASWKKFCPDCRIMEWNEHNFDFTRNAYMRQAYEAKRWGFATDCARLDVVYEYGGIYFDTDVELIADPSRLFGEEAFIGFEDAGNGELYVNTGQGFGAAPGNALIGRARDLYDRLSFVREDGSLNLLTTPYYTTMTLRQYGLVQENRDQELPGMKVFATDVFCPKSYVTGEVHCTGRTVSIHHFDASWQDSSVRSAALHRQKVLTKYGRKLGQGILVAESARKNYTPAQLLKAVPAAAGRAAGRKLRSLAVTVPFYGRLLSGKGNAAAGPAPGSLPAEENPDAGCEMFSLACRRQLAPLHTGFYIPCTGEIQEAQGDRKQKESRVVCGNACSGEGRLFGIWAPGTDLAAWKGSVLMGAGLTAEDLYPDAARNRMLRAVLSKSGIHSVRDRAAEKMLRRLGIPNVLYTGDPTLWDLTQEQLQAIPRGKSDTAVCTLSAACRDVEKDRDILRTLREIYAKVFFVPLSSGDEKYFETLGQEGIECVPAGSPESSILPQNGSFDCISTSFYAAVSALRGGHRTLFIQTGKSFGPAAADAGMALIRREDAQYYLADRLRTQFETKITIPWENIGKWKNQFGGKP
ncbi:MAG: polysaccharide pyruvyl transferase family protein [Lachnospiraceae bacterium]|jgi:hypothetical protein|nr:polysaccharide pyruvyl transferase family protein [Lachnospiraceae bacterium]